MSLKIRTEKHKNINYIIGNKFTIGRYQHENGTHTNFLINSEDFQEVSKYTWNFNKHYFFTFINSENIYLHELILNLHDIYKTDNNLDIDHVNLNKLDNRLENLRIVTKKENSKNREWKSSSNTGLRGIFYEKENIRSSKNAAPFRTTIISSKGKNKITGRYRTLEEAIIARIDDYESEHDFILDFPLEVLIRNIPDDYNITED
jgi:hypothetical protein